MRFARTLMSSGARTGALLAVLLCSAAGAVQGDDIAITGHRLHIECEGRGAPTVVLDAGLGGSSLEWVFVSERLRELTRVCTFDRAGYGGSDMGPLPRTSSRIANELYLLLEGAEVESPYILVGHSFGGYNAQIFARRYPFLTAGLVLIDASHPQQVERFLAPPLGLVTAPSSRYGIVQFRDLHPPHSALPEPVKQLIFQRAKRWKTRRTLASELLSFRDSALQVAQAQSLGDTPLLVITRGRLEGKVDDKRILMERLWLTMQSELALASSASAHLVARKAGHNVHIEQPNLVAFGVAMLVERYRRTLHSGDPGTVFPPPGYAHFMVEDAAWLHDTLNLYPLPAAPAQAALCAPDGAATGCWDGAP